MVLKARATAPEAGPKNGLPGNGVSREKQTNNNQKSKMKLTNKIVALTGIVAFAATPLFAGTGKTFKETVVVEEETPWYNLSVSTGWDSLYMYRGANVLNNPTNSQFENGKWNSYGDSIYWTNTAFTWNLTDTDSLSVGGWLGFGMGNTVGGYREFDLILNYTKTIENWTLGLGYTFYYYFPAGGVENYQNELNASVAYELDLGFMTLTPSATYFFNLGPAFVNGTAGTWASEDGHGGVQQASSFLNFKLAGDIPVYKEVVSLAPWTALGLNFGYNQTLEGAGTADPYMQWFNGFNNWEFGLALPIAINDNISVSGYVAYSYAFENLNGTTLPSTFWGGVNLALAF